ncbi:MAG: glycosyltransferase family 4 protein [Rhodothermales bacterium]|nr:glycosyltransferase family 4 protein [Rhodothermales bacterium]
MIIIFLLPPIQDLPTGGNRYNAEVIRRLTPARCQPEVWTDGNAPAPWPAEAVVLVDSLLALNPTPLAAIRARAGARRIALLAHYLPHCDPSATGYNALPSGIDRYVVPSRFMREGLIRNGVDPGCIAVAYPGTDPAPPAPRRPADSSLRLLTVASHLPVKGLIEAVEALAMLSNRDWQWDIVGDNSLDAAYSRRLAVAASAPPFAGRVRLLGSRPHTEVRQRLAVADLLVVPSRFESLGMAIREAMAAGLPVVAFDVGGVSESVAHERTGLLASAGDFGGLRGAVERLMDDPALRHRFGAAAREASRSFPRWEDAVSVITRHLTDAP